MEDNLSCRTRHLALLIPLEVTFDFGLALKQRACRDITFDEVERDVVDIAQQF